jgi:energy-coupling factor transporter transmembrane protein EcfT
VTNAKWNLRHAQAKRKVFEVNLTAMVKFQVILLLLVSFIMLTFGNSLPSPSASGAMEDDYYDQGKLISSKFTLFFKIISLQAITMAASITTTMTQLLRHHHKLCHTEKSRRLVWVAEHQRTT